MSRILYALTVHDRKRELDINRLLISMYLQDVDIMVFCNNDTPNALSDPRDAGYFWCKNTDHYQGALDHVNMIASHLDGYDYVVAQAAKTIWTDYKLVRRVIEQMRLDGCGIGFMKDSGGGHFGSGDLSFFCDVIVADVETYRKVFPLTLGEDGWPECAIARKTKEVCGDRIYMIPCAPPRDGGQSDFTFYDVLGSGHNVLSSRDYEYKMKQLEGKNRKYHDLVTGRLDENGARPNINLHVGRTDNRLEGWKHIDTPGIPYGEEVVDVIYVEHMMEHMNGEEGANLLRSCMKVLKPGGVCRVATLSLDHILGLYSTGRWNEQEWLKLVPEIKTPAEMLSKVFRGWDHQLIYDREELELRARQAGFDDIVFCERGESSHHALKGVEKREDSMLVAELRKPARQPDE